MMITLSQYFMGREFEYADECSAAIVANATDTVAAWNTMLADAAQDYIEPPCSPTSGCVVTSGWRPRAINEATPGAAKHSLHITGQALDCYDPEKRLAGWIKFHQDLPSVQRLWFEDFRTTPGWVHGQIVPPGSKRRIFIPSKAWAFKLFGGG